MEDYNSTYEEALSMLYACLEAYKTRDELDSMHEALTIMLQAVDEKSDALDYRDINEIYD